MARTTKTTKAKTAPAKAAEKKTVEAAPAAEKKVARKTCKTTVCVEMNGLSVDVANIQTAVKKAVKEQGLTATELKVYINAAEQAAYYTVNGEGGEAYKVDLKTL